MAAQPSTIEFYERRPLEDFVIGHLKFSPKASINLQVDYEDGLWIVSIPFVDAVGKSADYFEAKKMLMDYIAFLWNEYVLSPKEELGETGKLLRETLQELFRVS
jgi:hypothetical protein